LGKSWERDIKSRKIMGKLVAKRGEYLGGVGINYDELGRVKSVGKR
jgi:hypothetical protein